MQISQVKSAKFNDAAIICRKITKNFRNSIFSAFSALTTSASHTYILAACIIHTYHRASFSPFLEFSRFFGMILYTSPTLLEKKYFLTQSIRLTSVFSREMGVPKFYRYMSERYPCLSQVIKEHQIPEFDGVYKFFETHNRLRTYLHFSFRYNFFIFI